MRHRVFELVAIPVCLALLLSGCHDIADIDRRVFISPLGLDTAPDNKMAVYFRIPMIQPPNTGGSQGSPSYVIRGAIAEGIAPAWLDEQLREEHMISLSQCRSVILGEGLARKGIRNALDLFFRCPIFPPNAYMVVGRPDAKSIIDIDWPSKEMYDQNILLFFEDIENPVESTPLWRLFRDVHDGTRDPVVPLVEQSDDEKTMKLAGLAVIRESRMVGELDRDEAILFSLLHNSPQHGRFSMNAGGSMPVSYELVHGDSRIKARWEEDRVNYEVKMKIGAVLIEAGLPYPLTPDGIRQIERLTAQEIKARIQALLSKLQGLGSDPLDLGNRLRVEEPSRFSIAAWPEIYRQASFTVRVEFNIDETGALH